jgi:hypothetical protein
MVSSWSIIYSRGYYRQDLGEKANLNVSAFLWIMATVPLQESYPG